MSTASQGRYTEHRVARSRDELIAELDAMPQEEHALRIEKARQERAARVEARRVRAAEAAKRLREGGTE